MMTRIDLPPTVDLAASVQLADTLRAASGPVLLGGSAVERIGTAGLQLLLCAQRTARASGDALSVAHPSDALAIAIDLAGAGRLLAADR